MREPLRHTKLGPGLEERTAHDQQSFTFRATGRAFAILAWGVFALSFLKGFRFPSLWCATHFTFNYSQGFVRRGLVGEIARRIGGDDVYKYNVFVVVSFLILAAFGVAMTVALRRALRERSGDWAFRVALLVACASPGMVFLVHSVGYFDFLGLLALLLLLHWGERQRGRFVIFYAVTVTLLVLSLVHEGLVVMYGPAALFIALCHWLRSLRDPAPAARDWILLAAHTLLTVLLVSTVVVVVSRTSDVHRVQALEHFARRHADFKLRPDAFEVLTQSAYRNITVVVPGFWSWHASRIDALRGQITFVPGFLFVLYCAVRELAAVQKPKPARAALLVLFLVAAFAPEMMNIVGWDWPRWNSMALMNGLVCIVAYKIYDPDAPAVRRSLHLVTIGLLLTAVGLASTTALFDGYQVQFFPFDRQFEFIGRVLDGHFHYRPMN